MKQGKQQQAQRLYFQTDMSKSEIADTLGISRRTLHYWVSQNNWDRLRKSAQHMPALIAENVYIIMARFSESLISSQRITNPITKVEADTLRSLSLTIRNLKNRSTLNEDLQTMTCFLQGVSAKDPAMAAAMQPFVNDYIATRASAQPWQFMPAGFNEDGLIPVPDGHKEDIETALDMADHMFWAENNTPDQPMPETTQPEETHKPMIPVEQAEAPKKLEFYEKVTDNMTREESIALLREFDQELAQREKARIHATMPASAPAAHQPGKGFNRTYRREMARQQKKAA